MTMNTEAKTTAIVTPIVGKAKAPKAKAEKPVKAPKAEKPVKAKAEKPVKAKAVNMPNGDQKERLVPADLTRYTIDKEHKTAGGNPSVDTGDATAEKLRGKDLDFVYSHAAKVLKVDEKELRAKYAKLNVGMQRMNLGNRIRAAINKVEAKKAA